MYASVIRTLGGVLKDNPQSMAFVEGGGGYPIRQKMMLNNFCNGILYLIYPIQIIIIFMSKDYLFCTSTDDNSNEGIFF